MDPNDFSSNPEQADSTRLDVARHNANWTSDFSNESDASFPVRRRAYAEDRSTYAAALADEQAKQQQKLILTNKNAMELFKQQQQLDQAMRIHQDRMASEQTKAAAQAKMDDLRSAEMKARTANEISKGARDISDSETKHLHEATVNTQTDAFNGAISDAYKQGVKPASPEFAAVVHDAYLNNPMAHKENVQRGFDMAKIQMDPDEYLAKVNELAPQLGPGDTIKPNKMGVPQITRGSQARTENLQAGTQARIATTDLAKAREARMQSQFDRKLSDADTTAEDTKGFLSSAVGLEDTAPLGTPEHQAGIRKLMAEFPMADQKKIAPLIKVAGIGDEERQARFERSQAFREEMGRRHADQRDNAQVAKERMSEDEYALKQHTQNFREQQAQVTALAKDKAALTKEIESLEKKRPVWRNTTGIFKDKKGVERFGKAELPTEESPVATPEAKAEYNHFQALILQRAGIKAKVFNPETGKIE